MKNIFYILLLLPTIIFAQYPSNSGQKITLGEQTTADGLVYRGVASDTTRKPSVDTMAFILLDTNTNIIWQYKKATNNAWTRVGGSISSGLTGVLPVANGGTGKSALTANKVLVGNGTDTVISPTNLHWRRYSSTSEGLGIGTGANTDPVGFGNHHLSIVGGSYAGAYGILQLMAPSMDTEGQVYGSLVFTEQANGNVAAVMRSERGPTLYSGNYSFFTSPGTTVSNAIKRMTVQHDGKLAVGIITASELLDVNGNARFRAVGAGAFGDDLNITSDGTLTTETSDEKYKYNILPINYGLNTILQLKPVNFQWIKGEENDLGFIAQDVAEIIPEAVNTNWNSDLLMRYNSIIPILTKAIQEQNALIMALEKRILTLENK